MLAVSAFLIVYALAMTVVALVWEHRCEGLQRDVEEWESVGKDKDKIISGLEGYTKTLEVSHDKYAASVRELLARRMANQHDLGNKLALAEKQIDELRHDNVSLADREQSVQESCRLMAEKLAAAALEIQKSNAKRLSIAADLERLVAECLDYKDADGIDPPAGPAEFELLSEPW